MKEKIWKKKKNWTGSDVRKKRKMAEKEKKMEEKKE